MYSTVRTMNFFGRSILVDFHYFFIINHKEFLKWKSKAGKLKVTSQLFSAQTCLLPSCPRIERPSTYPSQAPFWGPQKSFSAETDPRRCRIQGFCQVDQPLIPLTSSRGFTLWHWRCSDEVSWSIFGALFSPVETSCFEEQTMQYSSAGLRCSNYDDKGKSMIVISPFSWHI